MRPLFTLLALLIAAPAFAVPPTITVVGDNPASVNEGGIYIDAGATAADAEDGDLTDQIVVNNPVDTSIPGQYIVTYSVTDSESITVNDSRTVNVIANTAPTITVLGADPVNVTEGGIYVDAGATAADLEDGDLTGSIITNNPVDTNTAGQYTVTYQVTDSLGLVGNGSRTVNVVANSPPTITVLGADPVNVAEGAIYVDAGATANDAEDGNLTGSINTTNPVDTNTPGQYTVTYSVTDSGGLVGNGSRTVNVVANTPPSITVQGANPVDVAEGSVYVDAGATANDAEDGNLTGSINTTNPVDTNTPGQYTVSYSVTDSGGLSDNASRTVNVVANTPPSINVTGPGTVNVAEGDAYNDQGATASDAEDGNLTGSIVTNNPVDTDTPGTYTVTYSVTDSGGLSDNASRTVNVVANTPPSINVTGPGTVNVAEGDAYNDQGATATDAEDGNITGSIVTNNPVDTDTPGTYTVTYSVTDSGGLSDNASRTVNVVANTPPSINVTGPGTVNIAEGDNYNDQGATATDAEDGNLTGSIVTNNPVDTDTAGTYTVTYSVTDSGGLSDNASRTVNVVANVPPSITVLGSSPVNVAEGDAYSDAGATASDAEDGNLTGSIVTNNPVDTDTPGSYTVTYSVTDSGGLSDNASRTVNVVANGPPVITVLGTNPLQILEGSVYVDAGATATDAEDGNLTASIVTNNPVDTSIPNTYTVTYTVTDSGGQVANASRSVTVGANASPTITILGANPESVAEGSVYTDAGATANDAEDGNLTASIVTVNLVNTTIPGQYTVTYTVIDSGGKTANAIRTVDVSSNAAPVITVLGENPTSATEGSVYTDAGATATDLEDGDLTASIVVDNPVDTAIAGAYTVTYTVTDSGGKEGTATRTVNVAANEVPVITSQVPLSTLEDTALELLLTDFLVTDSDNVYPTDFTLTVGDGLNYTHVGNLITPALDFAGDLTVPVTVNDGVADSAVFNAVVTVTAVNDPPIAVPQVIVTDEDIAVPITLTGTDVELDLLTFAIVAQPLNGTVTGIAPDILYTPNLNFAGADSFTFTVNDGVATSVPATVSITITGINDAPVIALPIPDQVGVEGSPFTLNVTTNFNDPDGDPLTYSATGLPVSGNIIFNGLTGVFSGTPRIEDARDNDPYVITVVASDGTPGGVTAVDEFDLNVSALDRANVSLQISVTPDPAMLNDSLSWTYNVRNTVGPQAATNVQLDGSFFGFGLNVTSTAPCTISPPQDQITRFTCTVGSLPVGGSTSVILNTGTTVVGDVASFATAATTDLVPIDPNTEDNSDQDAVGVAASISNGAVDVLGSASVLSVAFGDVNGDQFGDLIVGTAAGQPIQVWLGDGFRGFAEAPLTVADSAANEGLALADFDKNGTLDLAVANGGGIADMIYSNNGDGTFSPMATLDASFGQDVAVGDFNDDGNMDVAFATVNANPVFMGNGSGGMTFHVSLGNANSRAVAVNRFNADSRDDLVFANVGAASTVWTKNVAAGFTLRESLPIGDALSVTTGNFAGDASADIVFGRTSSGVDDVPSNPVLINDGTGLFGVPVLELGAAPTTGIFSGDVNMDGQLDLVFISDSGMHQIWTNIGGGGFVLHAEQIVADGSVAGVVAEIGMTDVGDPGGVDLAMGGALQPGVGIYLNDGFGNLGRGDAVAPEITLLGENPLEVPAGTAYAEPGATAMDNIDGDVSGAVVISGTVNSSVVGAYTVTYNVADFAGNGATPVERTVNITVATGTGGGGGGLLTPLDLMLLLAGFVAMQNRRLRRRS